MSRENDKVDEMSPPMYNMNSCFFDSAYMAIFGINDKWINENFLYNKIDKGFVRSFIPSLHLRANDGNSVYEILHKKNVSLLTKENISDIIEYAKMIPPWNSENPQIRAGGLP